MSLTIDTKTVSAPKYINDTKTVSMEIRGMSQPTTQQTRITLRLPQFIQEKAKQRADTQHISLNSFIVRAVERAIAQKPL